MDGTTISNKEAAISTLRTRLTDMKHEDCDRLGDAFYLSQWLKSHNFNVDKTEEAIRSSFDWRLQNKISTSAAMFNSPPDADATFQFYLDNCTKTGRPVGTANCGRWDMKSLVESDDGANRLLRFFHLTMVDVENLWLEHNQNLAECRKQSFTTEKAEGIMLLVNLDHFTFRQVTSKKLISTLIQALKDIVNYFPPMISDAVFINASKVTHILLKVLRPFMTFMKLEIYDCDERKWRAAISQYMDISTLRYEFGGMR